MKADGEPSDRERRAPFARMVGYALVAGAIWLSWEVVKAPVADRAPPAFAVRLEPWSPEVLRRAAETELIAGRVENARDLAAESLARAPFNARAMRVRGLAEARLAGSGQANEMLTLAGNWSLRDDPTHAWLTEYRLRRGNYGSAFAHADTLARRRVEAYPSIFQLFTTAAAHDPRSLPSLYRLLQAKPPWRDAFLIHLHDAGDSGAPLLGSLAIALEPTDGRLTDHELRLLYSKWAAAGRFPALRALRQHITRPGPVGEIQNSDFSAQPEEQLTPFGWRMGAAPGISTLIVEDDLRPGNMAFRLQYDGFGSGDFMEQLLLLTPGSQVLTGEMRAETHQSDPRQEWQLVCAESGKVISPAASISGAGTAGTWERFEVLFEVPVPNCSAQWLRLHARPMDQRTTIALWIDNLKMQSAPQATTTARPPRFDKVRSAIIR